MKKTWMLLTCVALMVSVPAFAAKKKAKKAEQPAQHEEQMNNNNDGWVDRTDHAVSGQGYGTAGCGLGSLAFGNKPGLVQIFASTTNGISGSQTFGITSGTSNCKPSKMAHTAELFITVNKEALAKDISRGSGESVASLSQIVGCSDSSQFASHLQKNYKNIFPTENSNSAEAAMKILNMIQKDQDLSKSCHVG